jgi:hypothetical protein
MMGYPVAPLTVGGQRPGPSPASRPRRLQQPHMPLSVRKCRVGHVEALLYEVGPRIALRHRVVGQ